MPERASDSEEKLPRLLHFIWAGGQNIMPPEQREAVIDWLTPQLIFFQNYLREKI